MEARLVRIPRHLLHARFEDLAELGVGARVRDMLRGLVADLPLVPDASLSAQLIGPQEVTLPCLAVLARHVGQGLRDHNLSLAREQLHAERCKLIFLESEALAAVLAGGDQRPLHEAVLFTIEASQALLDLLRTRDSAGLASIVASAAPRSELAHWRTLDLNGA